MCSTDFLVFDFQFWLNEIGCNGEFVANAVELTCKVVFELFAIAMAVIGGISLQGGRGSIIGTVLGAMVLGVIRSGFTYIKLDGSYQLMAMGSIIIAAIVLDQYRQRNKA